ncbi:MAG: AAA family ATPase, partial [Chloroflexota bacterium]
QIRPILTGLLAKKPENRFQQTAKVLTALAQAFDVPLVVETQEIRESYLQAAKFVGRKEELSCLKDQLILAERGDGSAWLIGGESGVGKSRLVKELRTYGLMRNFLVLIGRAEADGRGLPYQVWREPLQHLLMGADEIDDLTAGVLAQIVPSIDRILGRSISAVPNLNEVGERDRLHSGIAELVLRQTRPLLLILEDLQWADESLKVLPHIIDQVHDHPLMIVGTYRSEDWLQLPDFLSSISHIELGRMNKADIAKLGRSMLGEIGEREDLVEMLYRETEGNTFFLVEVVRALGEAVGSLNQISGASLPTGMIPQGIQAIIERRMARVDRADRELLLLAAVAGRQLNLNLLELLNEKRPLAGWLTRCAFAAVIEVQSGESWSFTHDKIREGIVVSLPTKERARLHRQIAQSLETLYADQADHAADLAYHWQHAGDIEKEQHYAFQAGQLARRQFRNSEAERYFERVLILIPKENLADRLNTLLAMDKLYITLVDNQKRQPILKEILALANELSDPDLLARGYITHVSYDFATSQMGKAIYHIEKAIHFGETADNKRVLGGAYIERAKVMLARGHIGEAMRFGQKSLEISREAGHLHSIATTQAILGTMLWYGRQVEALKVLDAAAAYFERYDLKRWLSYCLGCRGYIYCRQGYVSKGITDGERGDEMAQVSGARLGRYLSLMTRADVTVAQGQHALAVEYWDLAIKLTAESQDLFYLGIATYGRGDLAFRMGDIAVAQDMYQKMEQIVQILKDSASIIFAQTGLLRAAFVTGQRTSAHDLYANIVGYLKIDPHLKNIRHPLVFCLNLYHALIQTKPEEATDFLKLGEKIIKETAAQFEDERDQKTYLEQPYLVGEILSLLKPQPQVLNDNDTVSG